MKSVIVTVFCVAATACAWLAIPRASTTPAFAGEVTSATQRANTWHFVGWRMDGGKKLPWEVWGRRQPFFYREQVGDDILIDDGLTRLRLLPPDAYQKRGYAVALPSEKLTLRTVDGSEYGPPLRFVEGISGDYLNQMGEYSPGVYTGTQETGLTKNEVRLDVEKESHLPTRYRITRSEKPFLPTKEIGDSYGSPFPAADLAMKYDVAIPRNVMRLPVPSEYQRVDGHKGLELRPQFLGREADGSLHIKVDYWFGDKQIKDGDIFPWFHGMALLQCPPYTQPGDAHYPADDLGQSYVPTHENHGDSVDIYLKPASRVALTPRMVKIPVIAKLVFDKGTPDPNVEVTWSVLPVLSQETTLTVPLEPTTSQTSLGNK